MLRAAQHGNSRTKMAKRSNQVIEQYYFGMFRRDYQLPEGTIVHGDKPDVILEGKRKIGIEITNFFLESGALPESEQIQRKAREAVVSKAQQVYLSNGGKRIELSFSFDKMLPIRDQGKLIKKISAVAKNIDGLKTGVVSKDVFKDISELSFVYLNAKEYEDPKWRVVQYYSGQIMSMGNLRAIVNTKETQSKFYQRCDAYWLVVVVDFIDRAQDQEIQINGFEKIASTVFEKVIVYKTYFGHVFEAK
jgi:hypothetical protein